MIRYFVIATCLMFFSCGKRKEECVKPENDSNKFEMYQMSEMSVLMEQMYADNEYLKQRIFSGEKIGEFPQHFLKIHKAVMTDKQENDNFFKKHAQKFIESQELIYRKPNQAKEFFNKSIDECVACHKVKCGGPIVRIKKLYIE